ncbi:hypothetical protein H8356DRAFT_934570 [Neocallimastix lanati (nom. inval.)]|nr:hypothetical protein H8356DRAFT_934570 [Neocallimastix sp. JGI-2020a]
MVHSFSVSNSFNTSSIEGFIIKGICENETDEITKDIKAPVKDSGVDVYHKLLLLINKLQDPESKLSDKEIDEIYNETNNMITYHKSLSSEHIGVLNTLKEKLNLLYFSLKENPDSNKWNEFKRLKIDELLLKFNHTKMNETKILTEKKYSSKLEPETTDLDHVLNSALEEYKRNPINISTFFKSEAYAWVSKNINIDMSNIVFSYPNVFKNSINDTSEKLLKSVYNQFHKNSNRMDDIYEKLTLSQMNSLYKMDNKFGSSSYYIYYYLRKILPDNPKKLTTNSSEFKQLEDFANMVTNSLYKNDLDYIILYFKLKNAIVEGLPFNEKDFMKYLKIPYCYMINSRTTSNYRKKKPTDHELYSFIVIYIIYII